VGVLAAVAAAVAMLAVACGGGGGSPSQAGSSHPARSPIATKYASGWPGYEALLPVFGLLLLAVGIFVPGSLAQRVVFIALGGLFIAPYVILLAGRPVVFRADHVGITLGPQLPTLQFSSSGVIGWAEIDTVLLYKRVGLSNQKGKSPGTYIEIVLDDDEPAEPWATRRINTWRLDRQRLAAIAAAAAPEVRVVDTTADRKLWRRP